MIREKVEVKDFKKIAKEHKHFIWHFLQKEQSKTPLFFFSYFDEKNDFGEKNPIKLFVDNLRIPYFESYCEDSVDFLIDAGIDGKIIFNPRFDPYYFLYRRQFYTPMILGFNHFTKISSTTNYCYCSDGLASVIGDLNPEYLLDLNSKLSD